MEEEVRLGIQPLIAGRGLEEEGVRPPQHQGPVAPDPNRETSLLGTLSLIQITRLQNEAVEADNLKKLEIHKLKNQY